jgi:hypothetical protein
VSVFRKADPGPTVIMPRHLLLIITLMTSSTSEINVAKDADPRHKGLTLQTRALRVALGG